MPIKRSETTNKTSAFLNTPKRRACKKMTITVRINVLFDVLVGDCGNKGRKKPYPWRRGGNPNWTAFLLSACFLLFTFFACLTWLISLLQLLVLLIYTPEEKISLCLIFRLIMGYSMLRSQWFHTNPDGITVRLSIIKPFCILWDVCIVNCLRFTIGLLFFK